MQKIIARKKINFKLFLLILVILLVSTYVGVERFYHWQAKKKVAGLNLAIQQKNFFLAQLLLEEYRENFKVNQELLLAHINLLKAGKYDVSQNYQDEIIQLAFFLKSFFAYEEKELNRILGEAYYAKGESYFLESKNYLENFLKENPRANFDLELYRILYETNFQLGFLGEAQFYLAEIVKEQPEDIEFKIALVELLLKKEENLEAQELLEEIILSEEENPLLLKTTKLLFNLLHEFNLENKMIYYYDYLAIKFREADDFVQEYQQHYQKLKLPERKNL